MSRGPDQVQPVGHLVNTYLNLTENWIYNQIRFQTLYPSLVLALRLKNRDQFPWDRVYAFQAALPKWRQWLESTLYKPLAGYYRYHYKVAQGHGIQLLHAHHGQTGLRAVPLARALDLPLITSFYGADMYLRPKRRAGLHLQYRPLFERGNLFLVEGPAAQKQLESLGCPSEKIQIQRLGVNLDNFPYRPRQVRAGEPVRILMAATFTEKKGLPYGVEAFCQAATENNCLQLTVVGDAPPAKAEGLQLKKELKALVSHYHLEDRVAFLGYVSMEKLRSLTYDHHLFLHPSITASTGDSEGGSPVVLTEMAASGLPIIATTHCDIPQVVLDQASGILVEERNVDQLRLALLQLAADGQRRLQMGRRGHEHVVEQFSVKVQGQKLGEIYRDLLAGHPDKT